jgi:hypothetical protein
MICFIFLCLDFELHSGDELIIIQFFIIYVPSQQLQGQLQTQHSVDTIIIIIMGKVKQCSNNDNNDNRPKQSTDLMMMINMSSTQRQINSYVTN